MAGSKMRLNTLVYKGWAHEHEAMLARNDGLFVFSPLLHVRDIQEVRLLGITTPY